MGSSKARVNGELQQQQPAGCSSRESAHCSSWSNCSESITESRCSSPPDNSRDSATPIQQQPSIDTQNGNAKTEEEKPKVVASRWKTQQRRDKVGRQIDANDVPTSPAIRDRVPQSQPSFESNHCDHGQQNGGPSTSMAAATDDAGEKGKAIMHIRVGRLRLLEHSPLLHPGYDGGQVFVQWNFLDMARDNCETEGTARLPRHHSEQIHFDQQRAYELNSKRVALLKQWMELNILLTFTLAMKDPGENGGELNDLCTGGLDLAGVLNESQHTLIMRNVDNMAIAVLEVEVEYSEPLIQQIREDIDMSEEEDADESDMAEEEDLLMKLLNGDASVVEA